MSDPSIPQSLNASTPPVLPPMGYSEASWHAHVAAMRATAEEVAVSSPAFSLARAALSENGESFCGIVFRRLTAGGLLAIQGVARLAMDAGTPIEGPEQNALLVYCLADSENAFRLVEEGRLSDLLKVSRSLLSRVPFDELPMLTAFCTALIERATGQAEKKTVS